MSATCVVLRVQLAAEGIVLSGYPCVRDHILKVCEHDILPITCQNFTKFTN